jgi:transposase
MSRRKRRAFSAKFKTQVALDAIKERKTLAQLASEHNVTPAQIASWKKQLLNSLPEVFGSDAASLAQEHEQLTDQLYRKIGQLEMELDWLQKKVGSKAS